MWSRITEIAYVKFCQQIVAMVRKNPKEANLKSEDQKFFGKRPLNFFKFLKFDQKFLETLHLIKSVSLIENARIKMT